MTCDGKQQQNPKDFLLNNLVRMKARFWLFATFQFAVLKPPTTFYCDCQIFNWNNSQTILKNSLFFPKPEDFVVVQGFIFQYSFQVKTLVWNTVLPRKWVFYFATFFLFKLRHNSFVCKPKLYNIASRKKYCIAFTGFYYSYHQTDFKKY